MLSDHIDVPGELKSPSQQFQAASDSVGLYWWHWEHVSKKVRMSEGFAKILGLAPGSDGYTLEVIYLSIHPDDAERSRVLLQRLYNGEDDLYEIEYRIKDARENWKWFYNRGSVIKKDEDGRPVVIGGISMEISGSFTRLLSMVEEKDKFEFIFRNSNEAIVVIELLEGQAGNILDANKKAMEMFGSGPEVFGNPLPEYILQDDVIGRDGILMQDVFEKGFGRVERKVRIESGEVLWLEISLHAFTLTGENLMIAILKDKTHERKSEAALRESERLYQTVVEAANDRIGLFTVDGNPIVLNSAYYRTLGYTFEEYTGFGQYEIIHPDDRARLQEESKALFEKGFSSHEYRVKHKEGNYMDMSSKLVLIKGEDDEENLVLFINRDISERKRTIKELEEAKIKAEESDKLKSAFLANMSHEIRTPMNSIIGFSNLLNQSNLEEHLRELYVHRIISNSELLLTLISDIIDLAKIESGQLSIIYGRIRISDLIKEMEQYALDEVDRLQKDRIEIVTSLEMSDCEMETDVIRMTQVMKNLINNALKFTHAGKVEIGCMKGESEESLRFFVRDTGIGIAPEHFDVIFDQFRQIDGSNTRKFGGTGLGLAICKNLLYLMGGKIWVESEAGSGSIFQVEFPIKAKASEDLIQREMTQVPAKDHTGKKISVLAVDDEPDALELYHAMLTQMGHEVSVAETGYEALRILEQYPLPDLVLMDIQMPVMSGTDTLKIIRQRYPKIWVVAQSAHALTGDRDRFLGEGYDDYLPKPFTTAQLERVIDKLLSR